MEELFSDVNSRFSDYFDIQSKFWFWQSRLGWVPHCIHPCLLPCSSGGNLLLASSCVLIFLYIRKTCLEVYTTLPALYHILWEAIRADSSAEEINQALRTSHVVTADISFSESTGKTSCIYILFTEKEGLHGQSWRFTFQVSLLWFPRFIFHDLEMSNGLSLGPYGAGPQGFIKWQ